MQPKSIVAQRIQALRKEQEITQKGLCEATGIAINTIINYENSMREPQGRHLAKLEQFFGVSGSYLMGLTDDRTGKTEAEPAEDDHNPGEQIEQYEPAPVGYQLALDAETSDGNYTMIIVRCSDCGRTILTSTSTYTAGIGITHDLPRRCPYCGK